MRNEIFCGYTSRFSTAPASFFFSWNRHTILQKGMNHGSVEKSRQRRSRHFSVLT